MRGGPWALSVLLLAGTAAVFAQETAQQERAVTDAKGPRRLVAEDFDDQKVDTRLAATGGDWAKLKPPEYNLQQPGRGGKGHCFSSGTVAQAHLVWFCEGQKPWPTDELYVSFWMRYPTYKRTTDHENFKIFYPHWNGTRSSVQYVMAGSNQIIHMASGNGRWMGSKWLHCPGQTDGKWHRYEFYVKFSTTVARFWYDGALKVDRDYEDGSWLPKTVYYITFGSIDATAPGVFSRQFDDIEVWDGMPPGKGSARGAAGDKPRYAIGGATPGWPIPFNPKAKRVFYENYEEGECDRITPRSPAAVVSKEDGADVMAGKCCLRGNFDPKTIDPVTRKQGRKGSGVGVHLADTGIKDELYVSFLWRLDAKNSYACDRGGSGADPAYKMAYITGSAAPWAEKVNYIVIQRGDSSQWRIVNNSPNGAKTVSYGAGGKVGPDEAEQGAWHRVEFFLKLESTPGARDGVAILKVDGKLCIDRRDVPYLWKGGQNQDWHRIALPSMFGGARAPKSSFGWQLDEFEIWDGLPPSVKPQADLP